MTREEKIEQIKHFFDFWDNLEPRLQDYICDNMYEMTFDAGENIHNGDAVCLGILFVQKGMLRVYIMSEEGKEVTLYRVEEGDTCILAASCVLTEITFDVHVDSETETKVWVLSSGAFADLIERSIYIENYQNKLKAQRLSDVMWTMQQILFYSFDKRLAIFLYDELIKNGPVITYSHLEIAKYLGSAREVVSRMLKYFEKEGILSVSRKEILITDKKKLFDHTK